MKKISILLFVALAISTSYGLDMLCYDFHPTQPDMFIHNEPGIALNQLSPGAVHFSLDEDNKPIFSNKTAPGFPYTNYDNFRQWYREYPSVNVPVPISVPFTTAGNRFYYENMSFFPLDGQGFGNDGQPHNYYFTCTGHFYFTYEPGCTWRFGSDDDLWVFVNGILVADLGGLHQIGNYITNVPIEVVNIALTNALGTPMVPGETYRVDIFFAERMPTESALLVDVCNGSELPPAPVAPPVLPPITPPVTPPGASGDPHIHGFLGQKFDFHGDAEKVFNVLSDHDFQINAKVVGADLAPDFKKKTYFGSFGIKVGNDQLYIACDRALDADEKKKYGGHVIVLNGESIAESAQRQFEGDGFKLKLNERRHRLTIEHEVYTFTVQFSSSARSSCHLNLRSSFRSQKSVQQGPNRMPTEHSCPHGVLGQTVRPTPLNKSSGRNGEGVIEGIYTSYLEANGDVFGDSFEFNCFNPKYNGVLNGFGYNEEEELEEGVLHGMGISIE